MRRQGLSIGFWQRPQLLKSWEINPQFLHRTLNNKLQQHLVKTKQKIYDFITKIRSSCNTASNQHQWSWVDVIHYKQETRFMSQKYFRLCEKYFLMHAKQRNLKVLTDFPWIKVEAVRLEAGLICCWPSATVDEVIRGAEVVEGPWRFCGSSWSCLPRWFSVKLKWKVDSLTSL